MSADYGCSIGIFQTCVCPNICGEPEVTNCTQCQAGCHCEPGLWRFDGLGSSECVEKQECSIRLAEKMRKEEGKFREMYNSFINCALKLLFSFLRRKIVYIFITFLKTYC